MVKREDVVPGTMIVVSKAMSTAPAVEWLGEKFVPGMLLRIESKPKKNGGLNLVKVSHIVDNNVKYSGEVFYSFVTVFCKKKV